MGAYSKKRAYVRGGFKNFHGSWPYSNGNVSTNKLFHLCYRYKQ